MRPTGAPPHIDVVRRRAGGRNRYNARRRVAAMLRRIEVANLIKQRGGLSRGNQAAIARELEISEATVSRDLKALLFSGTICEHCGSLCSPKLTLEPIRTGQRKHRIEN
jgi:DeoR/GlpR family transcriptional regulator of sugar metabolism